MAGTRALVPLLLLILVSPAVAEGFRYEEPTANLPAPIGVIGAGELPFLPTESTKAGAEYPPRWLVRFEKTTGDSLMVDLPASTLPSQERLQIQSILGGTWTVEIKEPTPCSPSDGFPWVGFFH